MPPQTTNVHAAPCQRPPSSIVSIRLRYVSDAALAVAAERDVEVVAEPARERHVPAPPEVLQRDGRVRRREVLRELEPEQKRDADRDVRVAAEVGEDLHRVAVDADEHLERRVPIRRGEDVVDDVSREVVRDHDLQEEAGDDQEERARRCRRAAGRAATRAAAAARSARTIGPATRCGKNAWNTANRVSVVGTSSPPVRVDDVRDRHEGEEGDADRQRRRWRSTTSRATLSTELRKKFVYLKYAEEAEVERDRRSE